VTTTGDYNFFVLRDGCLNCSKQRYSNRRLLASAAILPSPDAPLESVSIAETLKDEKSLPASSARFAPSTRLAAR
jgi:hypothetical protein